MPRQQPQIALPLTIPAGTVTVDWHTAPTDTFSLSTATRYNDRLFSSASTNAGAYLKDALLGGASGVWGISERSGFAGRYRLQVLWTDYPDSLALPAGLGQLLGFASSTITPTSVTGPVGGNYLAIFDAPYRAFGLYIPEPSSEVYFDPYDVRSRAITLGAQALSGPATLDVYPTIRRRLLTLNTVRGYSAQSSYLQAGFGSALGVSTSDPNFAWDDFVAQWRAQASPVASSLQCAARLALDVTDPSVYEVVYPDTEAAWVADPLSACTVVSLAPLVMVLSFELLLEGVS
jgi:hypothetical protein